MSNCLQAETTVKITASQDQLIKQVEWDMASLLEWKSPPTLTLSRKEMKHLI